MRSQTAAIHMPATCEGPGRTPPGASRASGGRVPLGARPRDPAAPDERRRRIDRVDERELGRSGIAVSRIILGCGNFGGIGSAPQFFGQGTPKDEAFRLLDAAWELGVTSLDTADAYGGGRSESFIGEWLATKGPEARDRVVITTKTFNPMAEGADRGLSRARILRQIDTSLERLRGGRGPPYVT